MTVSVVIPTYDRPDLLVRCVRSVLGQSVRPDEVIVVDDASSIAYDEARRELQRLADAAGTVLTYERLPESGGACRARNRGAELAQSELLMFVDDDDTWTPEKIAGQLACFEAHPDAGLVYAGRRVVNEQEEDLYRIVPRHTGDLRDVLLEENVVGTTSSVAVRAHVFEAAGGFDVEMPALQDYDLWLRCAQEAPFAIDPHCTVRWTVHAEAAKQMAGRPALYHAAFARLDEKYAAAFAGQTKQGRRRSRAWKHRVLATKYAQVGDWSRQWWHAMQSLWHHPTVSGLSKLLPASWARLLRSRLAPVQQQLSEEQEAP
jgi:glycosyltransferase involved in cell wall biosynthesis